MHLVILLPKLHATVIDHRNVSAQPFTFVVVLVFNDLWMIMYNVPRQWALVFHRYAEIAEAGRWIRLRVCNTLYSRKYHSWTCRRIAENVTASFIFMLSFSAKPSVDWISPPWKADSGLWVVYLILLIAQLHIIGCVKLCLCALPSQFISIKKATNKTKKILTWPEKFLGKDSSSYAKFQIYAVIKKY